jgi:hypothetical protein
MPTSVKLKYKYIPRHYLKIVFYPEMAQAYVEEDTAGASIGSRHT